MHKLTLLAALLLPSASFAMPGDIDDPNVIVITAPGGFGADHGTDTGPRGGGGEVGPPPSTEQRLAVMERQAYEEAKKGRSWLDKSIEIWKCTSGIEVSEGVTNEEWRARLRGNILGMHSDRTDTLEDAKAHLDVKIEIKEPLTYRGIGLPIPVTRITVTFKKTGDSEIYYAFPQDYVWQDNFSEMFKTPGHAQRAAEILRSDPTLNLQDAYDCVERLIAPTGHPGKSCPVFSPGTGGFSGEGL